MQVLPKKDTVSQSHNVLPLKDVDVEGVKPGLDSFFAEEPAPIVTVPERVAAGKTLKSIDDKGAEHLSAGTQFHVISANDAPRFANAIPRAATRCGAKSVF